MLMPNPPLPFLTALPAPASTVAALSHIQLWADAAQQLIVATGDFSNDCYQPTDFAALKLDFPPALVGAVPKRQAEYLAGRYLARLVMQQSGLFVPEPPQLGIGQLRAPNWPAQVTGSITHHQHKACVALLTQPLSRCSFVGIDTELWLSTSQAAEIAGSVHSAAESYILQQAGFSSAAATSLIFSAKEALFKAICPFVGEYFDFACAELTACTLLEDSATASRSGQLTLRLSADWVVARAPRQSYCCWFSGTAADVTTLVCGDGCLIPVTGSASAMPAV